MVSALRTWFPHPAIALLERKGFSATDFQRFHPGGKLGRRLLRVGDIMHSGDAVPLISPMAPMSEAILVMTAKSFGCVAGRARTTCRRNNEKEAGIPSSKTK